MAFITGPAWDGPARTVSSLLGAILLIGGAAGFVLGARTLDRSFSIWAAPAAGAMLVVTGPYRYLRHPICTSQVVMFLGVGIVAASPAAIAMVVALAVYLDRGKLAAEEAFLRRTYAAYDGYAKAVPRRMFPGPPASRRAPRPAG